MTVLLIDCRDSFTENLAAAIAELGPAVEVWRAEHTTAADVRARRPGLVVLGPGPRRPSQSPGLPDLVAGLLGEVPLFGVCLGLQVLLHHAGAQIVRAHVPRHGKSDPITHDGTGLFAGLPSPCWAMRYHSLVADRAPAPYVVTAQSPEGHIMAAAAPSRRAWGVQFHPESIGTEGGLVVLANALDLAGVARQKVVHRAGGIPAPRVS